MACSPVASGCVCNWCTAPRLHLELCLPVCSSWICPTIQTRILLQLPQVRTQNPLWDCRGALCARQVRSSFVCPPRRAVTKLPPGLHIAEFSRHHPKSTQRIVMGRRSSSFVLDRVRFYCSRFRKPASNTTARFPDRWCLCTRLSSSPSLLRPGIRHTSEFSYTVQASGSNTN